MAAKDSYTDNSCIIKKHIFSVGSLNCFVVINDQERLGTT